VFIHVKPAFAGWQFFHQKNRPDAGWYLLRIWQVAYGSLHVPELSQIARDLNIQSCRCGLQQFPINLASLIRQFHLYQLHIRLPVTWLVLFSWEQPTQQKSMGFSSEIPIRQNLYTRSPSGRITRKG